MPFRHNKDKDTVDRRELRIALNEKVTSRNSGLGKDSITFTGFHNAAALTDAVVDDIILNRPAPGEFGVKPESSEHAVITREELDAALRRLNYGSVHASVLFEDIKVHREPTWKRGDVVKDADNVFWRRITEEHWTAFGNSGLYSHDHPLRPLKLVFTEDS